MVPTSDGGAEEIVISDVLLLTNQDAALAVYHLPP